MVSMGDGQDGVSAWGRGEPRAWSLGILVPLVTSALPNT